MVSLASDLKKLDACKLSTVSASRPDPPPSLPSCQTLWFELPKASVLNLKSSCIRNSALLIFKAYWEEVVRVIWPLAVSFASDLKKLDPCTPSKVSASKPDPVPSFPDVQTVLLVLPTLHMSPLSPSANLKTSPASSLPSWKYPDWDHWIYALFVVPSWNCM